MLVAIFTVLMNPFRAGGGSFSFEKAFEPFLKETVTDQPRYEQAGPDHEGSRRELSAVPQRGDGGGAKELKALIATNDANRRAVSRVLRETRSRAHSRCSSACSTSDSR